MAYSSIGTASGDINKTSSTTWNVNIPLAVSGGVGLSVLILAFDNITTTTGESSDAVSIVVALVGSYTKAGEYTYSPGGASSGVTVSVWYLSHNVNSAGAASVITFSGNVTAKAYTAWNFGRTFGVITELTPGAIDFSTSAGAAPASQSLSSLASNEYLFIRALGSESSTNTAPTPTTNYTVFSTVATSGGGSAGNISVSGEWRILTGTGDTSAPSQFTSDKSSIYLALRDYEAPPASTVKNLGLLGVG